MLKHSYSFPMFVLHDVLVHKQLLIAYVCSPRCIGAYTAAHCLCLFSTMYWCIHSCSLPMFVLHDVLVHTQLLIAYVCSPRCIGAYTAAHCLCLFATMYWCKKAPVTKLEEVQKNRPSIQDCVCSQSKGQRINCDSVSTNIPIFRKTVLRTCVNNVYEYLCCCFLHVVILLHPPATNDAAVVLGLQTTIRHVGEYVQIHCCCFYF